MDMKKVEDFMQYKDPNGDFDGIGKEDALEIIKRWYEDSLFSDKGCKKMIAYLKGMKK